MADSLQNGELAKHLKGFADWTEQVRLADEASHIVTEPLYHYTNMAGLKGIVESQTMWLTSIFHLNDPSELAHGLEIALQHLNHCGSRNALSPTAGFCRNMRHILTAEFGARFGFFVGSFSRSAEDLAQWRAYADDGRGVCIEIAPEWFKPKDYSAPKSQDAYIVAPVLYKRDDALGRQHAAIDRAIAAITAAQAARLLSDPKEQSHFLGELGIHLAPPLLWNALTTKHPAYEHEAETRVVLLNRIERLSPITRTRVRGSDIVSYVPIDLPLSSPGILRRVMVGPAARDQAETGVENLLRAHGIAPGELVSRSEVPYRSL